MQLGLDFISYFYGDLPNSFITKEKSLGRTIITWTVRDEKALRHTYLHADQMTFEGFDPMEIAPPRDRRRSDAACGNALCGYRRSRVAGACRRCPGAPEYNPFISHAFLSALEESRSADAETGWLGQHLLLKRADGQLIGALPCYLKSHSQGEYVFDHAWADAFQRAGGRYYPKLQSCVPFTPATGPRLLARTPEGSDAEVIRIALAEGLKTLASRLKVSSAHVTFVPEAELAAFEAADYLHRTDQQFHFTNDGYGCHDDFLATLASRKRKGLKRERRDALANGITIDWLTGSDLTEDIWDQFYAFYMDTGSRKWGRPYLTRSFYSLIGERMPDDILLVMAKREGRYIAGAINFIGADALYGRHWGCLEDHPFLHFEVCYHQAIDFAIAKS